MWLGDTVYFLSDRDGVSNVWAFAPGTAQLAQLTRFTDFDVKALGAGGGALVFEQAGYVHELDLESGKVAPVPIRALGDFPWMMTRWEEVTGRITSLGLSPTGKRVPGATSYGRSGSAGQWKRSSPPRSRRPASPARIPTRSSSPNSSGPEAPSARGT